VLPFIQILPILRRLKVRSPRCTEFSISFSFFAASFPGMAAGQQASPSSSATNPEPTPIPLAKVPLEAETTRLHPGYQGKRAKAIRGD
jgi:hypothetical protein